QNNVFYKPSQEEILATRTGVIPANTRKATDNLYLLNHPNGNHQFILSNKKEFRLLWSILNGKLKQLKKYGTIVKHHNNLTDEEIQQIFQHNSVSINDPQDLQYRIFIWCCLLFQPRGGEHYSIKISQFVFMSDGLIIPIPPDSADFQGPIHDFKLYISKHPNDCQCPYLHLRINNKFAYDPEESWYCDKRLGEKLYQTFMKNICNIVGVSMVTTMAITGHKSESSYQVYTRPSEKDKEDALSSLINNIELPLKQNN
ncbi:30787_t:CDS:2, partial [Racocetra persica]